MQSAQNRIETLRQHALACKPDRSEWKYLYAKGFLEGAGMYSAYCLRHAHATRTMLEHAQPVIDEGELIVGKMSGRSLTADERAEWELLRKYALAAMPAARGQASHMAVDYALLLEKGAEGIAGEIEGLKGLLDLTDPGDLEKNQFYDACLIALEGLCSLADAYAALAARQAETCGNPARKGELLKIAEVCAQVPRGRARSFYEAVQSVSFLTFCLSGPDVMLYQLGRPDRYLLPYYRADIEKGVITREEALELIDCLGLLYNEYIPTGLAAGLMVGGRDENGRDVSNELTRLFLESIGRVRMIYPGVGLCWTPDTPADVLELSCEMLGRGCSHPALFNDDIIIEGLRRYGLPYRDACHYIHSTCVEITPASCSATWVASPYTNLPQLLLDTLGIKPSGSAAAEFETFEALKAAFFERLALSIRGNLIEQNRMQIERTRHTYNPLLSCFVSDCLQKGLDIESGGARYNWIMPSFVGVSNVADSLGVIEETVYRRGELTLARLAEILEKDFEGFEDIRQRFLEGVEKYGNDVESADAYVGEITRFIAAECSKYTTFRGGKLVPSLFCWVMHNEFGVRTMATPDGRKSGFPLGDGSGPAQGREKKGPTASILSSTKWEHTPFIGGIAVNLKFSKKMFGEASARKLTALIQTFMQRGGFELQLNALDRETLEKAVENPELYGDLIVRVGGYSDYFVRLSPSMQAEVMQRTQHIL